MQAPPAPLQSGNVVEIDVISGSGATRGMPFCPNGVCPPTKTAR